MMNDPIPPDRLHYNHLFELFPAAVRAQLFEKAVTRQYKAGDVIFRRGEEGPWFCAILAGRVRVSVKSFDGKELLLTMVERNEIFGERAVLDGLLRAADSIAEEDTTVLVFQRDDFLPILFKYPDAMYGIIKMLCHRMLRYTHTIELYALQNLPERLATLLLFLEQKYGVNENGHRVIRAGFNQSDLANQLASSRESINKQLKIFVGHGYIRMNGHDIVVLDREALRRLSEPSEAA